MGDYCLTQQSSHGPSPPLHTGCYHCGITDSLGAIVRTHQGGRPTFLIREPHYAFDVFSSVMDSFSSARQWSMQTDLIFLKEYATQLYKCLNPYKSLIHFYSSNILFKMERQLGGKGKKCPLGSTDLECCFWLISQFIKLNGEFTE